MSTGDRRSIHGVGFDYKEDPVVVSNLEDQGTLVTRYARLAWLRLGVHD